MTTSLRTSRRVEALFRALSTDFLLREQFVTDPAQVLAEYVEGKGLPSDVAALSNQLLYSVLSNPDLVRWIREYAGAHPGQPPSGAAFVKDFSRAVAQHGDEQVIIALIRGGRERRDLFGPQSELLRAIIGVLGGGSGVFSGTEMSPGGGTEVSPGGTEMSPGRRVGGVFSGTEMSPGGGTEVSPGGTEMSPGRRVRGVFSGTEMSPGGGTEMSPGGTEMSPGRRVGGVLTGTEKSPGYGTEKSGTDMSPGKRVGGGVFTGTEMSPGGGTEMSPGGTEMSPGARLGRGRFSSGTEVSPGGGTEVSPGGTEVSPGRAGRFGAVNVQVTFEALVQFATQLRRSGALNLTGFENDPMGGIR